MGNPAEEKRIFAAFLSSCPLFADSPVTSWAQPQKDPPDIECSLQVDLPPFLTQSVKTQNPFKGELSHGVVEKDVHQGV